MSLADSARVGMLTFQTALVTVQAIPVKSVIAVRAIEICRASRAIMDVPREVTGSIAITMPTALINPVPPSQTRTESIRRANVPLIYALHKGETLHSHSCRHGIRIVDTLKSKTNNSARYRNVR